MTLQDDNSRGSVRLSRIHPAVAQGHLWIYAGHLGQVVGQPAAGDLIDVLTPNGRFYGRGFFNPFAKTPIGFGGARAALGVPEAGNFPAAIKTTAEWFPKKERALATGIFNSGTNVGAIVAPLVVPWIAVTCGWQEAFIITGAIGLIWFLFWFVMCDSPEKKLAKGHLKQTEYDHILSDKEETVNADGQRI